MTERRPKQRFQLMLEPNQIAALRRIEKRTGAALAEQIRRAVDVWVRGQRSGSPGYVWQKLYETMHTLAGPGSIQRRLGRTASSLVILKPEDFDEKEHRDTFAAFLAAMTKHQDTEIGSFAASAKAMTDDEASQWAGKLVELFNSAARGMGAQGYL